MSLSTDLNAKYGRNYLTFRDVDLADKDIVLFDQNMLGNLDETEESKFNALYTEVLLRPDTAADGYFVIDEDEVVASLSETAAAAPDPKETYEYSQAILRLKQEASDQGRIDITKVEWDKAVAMSDRLRKASTWVSYLSADKFIELFTQSTVGDGVFNGSVDTVSGSIISVKHTTGLAEDFPQEIQDKNYDMEAFINYEATGKATYFVVQETEEPYLGAVYKMVDYRNGEDKLTEILSRIQSFLDDYPDDAEEYHISKTI